ncbi:MAG: hypothetical protein AAGM21_08150 [Pseudomonadota bacterium]
MKDSGLSAYRLTPMAIRAGVWEGVLTLLDADAPAPVIDLCLGRDRLTQAQVSASADGTWQVKAPLPADALSQGVHTFCLVDRDTGMMLESFTMALGEPLDTDLRAEIDLLRAELDLLKRAFRRHCAGD